MENAITQIKMEKKEGKKDKMTVLIKELYSTDSKKVSQAITAIREKGDVRAVEPIIDVLITSDDPGVKEEAEQLLYDLKDEKAIPVIMDALSSDKSKGYRNILVASLWQSSLEANDHISFLVDLAIEEDYLTCLECLTVIENLENVTDEREVFDAAGKIEENLNRVSEEKQELLKSLATVLQNFVIG